MMVTRQQAAFRIGFVALVSCLFLTGLTGCGNNNSASAKPAPATSVDMKSLSPQTRQAAEAAIAQGKYQQQKASADGAAYMEAMKRMNK